MYNSQTSLTDMVHSSGCAAKLAPGALSTLLEGLPEIADKKLLIGHGNSDDACAYELADGTVLLQTVDFFPPMVDDPYLFGQIAATNALSDIYAMGGTPKLALNLLCFPSCLPLDQAAEIIRGAANKAQQSGCLVAGGHSIADREPKFGMCVSGFTTREALLSNSGAKAGDALVLTKPLGVGLYMSALKAGIITQAEASEVLDCMTQLNGIALKIAQNFELHALTDVTGFGLIGHASEMTSASELNLCLEAKRIPFFDRAAEFAALGLVPEGSYNNRKHFASQLKLESLAPQVLETLKTKSSIHSLEQLSDLLFDPQTSGGLLMAVAPQDLASLLESFANKGQFAAHIGHFEEKDAAYTPSELLVI